MRLYLFPIIIFIIMLVFSILIIKDNKGLDNKLLATMLFKYSTVLLFAIVEYIYLSRLSNINKFLTLVIIDLKAIMDIHFGYSIYKTSKKELDDNALLELSRTSIYIILETILFVAIILVNKGTL